MMPNAPKRKRRWWRVVWVIIGVLATVAAVAGAALYLWFRNVTADLPTDLSAYKEFRPPSACQIMTADGTLIDRFYVEKRIWIGIDELPDIVGHAFVAAEDSRFYQHSGVDYRGTLRAARENLASGRKSQGGSTLTQQLVKHLIVGSERTYTRKVREATMARRFEKVLSKREILEMYLNYVYLGSGNYGVEAASQDYFGVSARWLTPAQAALLAGLVPAPNRYSPRNDPAMTARKRDIVLRLMHAQRYITDDELSIGLAEPIAYRRTAPPDATLGAAYATHVRREVRRLLGDELPAQLGLRVHTPMDLDVQRVAEVALREGLHALQDRQGRRAAITHVPEAAWNQFLAEGPGLPRTPEQELRAPSAGDCFRAMVGADRDLDRLAAGRWTFPLAADERDANVLPLDGTGRPRPLSSLAMPGDVMSVCLDDDGTTLRVNPRPFAEGAVVVLENRTGHVIAMVGGYDDRIEGLVRATQARRQPGSSFKTYVYAAALAAGRHQLDTETDSPLRMPGAAGKSWSPRNFDGEYRGRVTLRRAFALSLNTVSVRLTMAVSPAAVRAQARAMGVDSPLHSDITIALGSAEVTPLDQAVGFSTVARGGVPPVPVFIRSIEDVDGTELGRAGGPVVIDGTTLATLPGGDRPRALPAGVAYELVDMMREVIRAGTGRRGRRPGFDRAGKTGTTNDYRDAWFIGFTPRYTVAVWVGTDGTATLGESETGGRVALPIWNQVVSALLDEPNDRIPIPDEAVLVRHEGQWMAFPRGRVPANVLPANKAPRSEPLPAAPSR